MKTIELSDEDIEFMRGVLDEFPQFVEDYDTELDGANLRGLYARCKELRTKLWRAK